MFSYNILEWMLFFYIYCAFGWIFESTWVSLRSRRFVNRGFMKGPMIPIYGEGAIMMVVATYPVRGNIWLEFVMGMVGATLLEFVVGAIMEYLFKVKYWDYSKKPFNIKGYICLTSTICWGVLSVLLAEYIHPAIDDIVISMNVSVLSVIVTIISIIFIVDSATSAKEAWDLRILLVALTKAKEEIAALQQQYEIKKGQITEQLSDKKEELVEELYAKKDSLMKSLKRGTVVGKDVEILKKKIEEEGRKYQALVEKLSLPNISILRRNPGATSIKFYEALESIKDHIENKKNDN